MGELAVLALALESPDRIVLLRLYKKWVASRRLPKIRAQGADYVLAVKKIHKELHQAIEDYFETAQQAGYRAVPLERLEEVDSGHGRVEVRGSELVPANLSILPKLEQWKDLQGVAWVEGECHLGDRISTEVHYSITSFGQDTGCLAEVVQGHWGIENSAQLGAGRDLPGRRQPTDLPVANTINTLKVKRKL
jgi:hypothetical protein